MRKLALVNHGCAKNLVDSELMLGLLAEKGYEITLDENDANVVIVNTCSFIHDAEKESVQSILKLVNEGKKVIVTGCLPQKYKGELKEANTIGELDNAIFTPNHNIGLSAPESEHPDSDESFNDGEDIDSVMGENYYWGV